MSGTSSSIRTKLIWNSHWMVLFQNCVRQSHSPIKMATTVQLCCYWKQLWFRWAITGSWEPLVFLTFSSPEAKAQVNFAHQFQLAPVIFPYFELLPKNQWPKLDHAELNGTLSMNLFAKICRDFPDIFDRHISFRLDKKRLDGKKHI